MKRRLARKRCGVVYGRWTVRELLHRLKSEIAFSNSLVDDVVPYTAIKPVKVGETVMVRVPRRFLVRP
jgi:hypothetical protein